MTKTTFHLALLFAILVLAQGVIFNHLVLFGCAMPFVFVYLLITLPATTSANVAMSVGFALGLCIDAFSDTYGVNALCCTVLAFMRRPMLRLYVQRDEDFSGQALTLRTMGAAAFMKYSLTMTAAYCLMAVTIESFAFVNFWRIILRIISGTLYTFVLIYAIDSLSFGRHEKKL